MTDPLTALGAAASVAQFVVLARQVSTRLRDYHANASRAPRTLLNIQDLIPIMLQTCEMAREQQNAYDNSVDTTLEKFVNKLLTRLQRLDESTQDLMPVSKDSRMRRTAKAFKSMTKEKELIALQRDLETSDSLLANYLIVKRGRPTALEQKHVYLFPSVTPGVKRKRLSQQLNDVLSVPSLDHPHVLVLYGLGGQGKTSLALDACRAQQPTRDVILWMNASSKQSLRLDFATSIRALSLRRQSIYDLEASSVSINTALAGKTWLLVFDNYDAPEEVGRIVPYFPSNGNGTIIITTRYRQVRNLGQSIDVGGMEEDEAIELLLSRTNYSKNDHLVVEKARKVVSLLGYLPLAIDQAGAYIGERNLAVENFEKHYSDRRDRIFNQTPTSWDYNRIIAEAEPVREIPQSVMTTWELSFEQLNESSDIHQHLAKFLSIAAFMTENSISEDIFREFLQEQPESVSSNDWLSVFCIDGRWDTYAYQDLLAKLANLSLIQEFNTDGDLSTFSLHPMVKQWLLLRVKEADRRNYIREASHIIATCFASYLSRMSRRHSEKLLSHQDAVVENSKPFLDINSPFGADDLRGPALQFAEVYAGRARWGKATALLNVVLRFDMNSRRLDDPVIIDIKCKLADVYTNDGKYAEARNLLEPILTLDQNQHSQRNDKFLEATMGLASVYTKTDQLPQACSLYEKALDSFRADEAPNKAIEVKILGHLARVYRYMGQHSKALYIYEEALKNDSQLNLSTLRVKAALADLQRNKAQFHSAKSLYSQAHDGFAELLGPDHPETVGALCNLAITHRNLEAWQDAEETFWNAIALFDRVLGSTHVDTLRARMNLAIVYDKQGQTALARKLYAQVLAGREQKLGLAHSYTLRTVERLCTTMLLLDDEVEAERLALRTLQASGPGKKVTTTEATEWGGRTEGLFALQRLFSLAVERERKKLGEGHMDLLEAVQSFEEVEERQRRLYDQENKGTSSNSASGSPDSFHSAVDTEWAAAETYKAT